MNDGEGGGEGGKKRGVSDERRGRGLYTMTHNEDLIIIIVIKK